MPTYPYVEITLMENGFKYDEFQGLYISNMGALEYELLGGYWYVYLYDSYKFSRSSRYGPFKLITEAIKYLSNHDQNANILIENLSIIKPFSLI